MSEFEFHCVQMPQIGVLRYDLIGVQPTQADGEHANTFFKNLAQGPYTGVLFDYTRCTVDHTSAQITAAVNNFAPRVPAGLKLAYVYGPNSLMVCARVSRLLAEHGVDALAFDDEDEAMAFLTLKNWCRPLHA